MKNDGNSKLFRISKYQLTLLKANEKNNLNSSSAELAAHDVSTTDHGQCRHQSCPHTAKPRLKHNPHFDILKNSLK